MATFERDEVLISSMPEMNHTPSGTKSQLLTGGYNSQVGATKSFKVYPGDKVKAEVYSKYRNISGTTGNILQFAAALTSAFGMTPGGSIESTTAYNSMNTFGSVAAAGNRPDDDASPKGFVTILLFDKNYNFLDAGWDQLDGAYEQTGVMDNDPFDLLEKEVTVKEEGYVYIFVSNENPTQVDIHFDDLNVTHTKTNVIQYNEYYPFGLQTSTSWTREGSKNDFLYNAGNELNSGTGWYDMFFRNYDPAIGRMMQVDPYASMYGSHSTYNYGLSNPVMMNDPNGGQASAGGYVYTNAAADRLNKIYNPDLYTEAWAEDFAGYTASLSGYSNFDKNGNVTYTNDPSMIAAIVAAVAAGSATPGSEEWFSNTTLMIGGMRYMFDVAVNNNGMTIQRTPIRGGMLAGVIGGMVQMGPSEIISSYSSLGQMNGVGAGIGDFTKSNWALEIGGGIFGAMEGATAGEGYWLGKNGKYYTNMTGRGPNQYTGSRLGALKAANMYKWAGRGTVALSAVIGGVQTYQGYHMDGDQFGYNAQSAAAQTIGGIGGGIGGAVLGAKIGAGIGVWFGGVGAIPGAIIGGFAGGIIGGWAGSSLSQGAVNIYHGR